MVWYNPLSWGEKNASTNLSDYASQTQFQDRGQIMGAITPGLQTQRTAPQAGMDGPFRGAQINQIGQLQGIASGQQQGAGELAAARQAQNALAAQQSMARMARGGNAALAMRSAADNSAGIGISAAGMGQQAAMQDQMQAQGMLTGALGQARGQDQQVQLANLDAQLKQMGMDDAQRLGYLQQLTGMNAAQLNASVGAMQAAQAGNKPGYLPGLISAGAQVAGAAAIASDERAKTDITDSADDIDDMLDKLRPTAYRYKDEDKHGKGRRAGIMAQDMAKSRAGKAVVIDDIGGGTMGLDVGKAVSASLAAAARLNQRVRELEKKGR